MAKRPAPAKTETQEAPAARGARGAGPENQARLDHILARAKEEPGIESPKVAHELQITTLQCSQLADRLVRAGTLGVFKLANGTRTYYMPKVLEKALPKLEKQREADLANRETDRAEKAKAALAELKAKKAAQKAEPAPAAKTSGRKTTKAAAEPAAPAPKPARKRSKVTEAA